MDTFPIFYTNGPILGEHYYVKFAFWHGHVVYHIVCNVFEPNPGLKFLSIFLHHVIANGLGQSVLTFWKKIKGF